MEERSRLFLQESFELMTKTQMSSEQVYRFWQMNVDEIDLLLSAMPTLAAQIIEKDREERESIAHIFGLFGRLIQRFPHGNRRVNLELAIINYQICVDSFSQEREPSQWASYKYNLGLAYFERVAGDREVNIELGIRAYQDALKVITYQNFMVEWAKIQHGLGTAYLHRTQGDYRENIKLAIEFFQNWMESHNTSEFDFLWSKFHSDLLLTYRDWITANRQEVLGIIVDAFQDSLTLYTRQNFPVEWARTQYILGVAYSQRIMGERKRNLELAIDAFRAALEIYSCSGFLCTKAIDVDLAAYYTLKGFPCPGFPLEYRMIQDDLEIACYDILEPDLDLLQFEDLSLNRLTYEVYRGQRAIELTPEEFNLIKYLMCNPQQILSRDLIIRNVWDCDFSEELNIVEVHVRYLRRKLEQEGDRRLLYTVRGFGYSLGVHGHCGITGRE